MRRLRHNRRGQFAIIAALLIAALTLSLAFSIHQINLHRQELRYQPVNELLLGVTSDMERALTKGLANFTYAVLYDYSIEPATEFMLTWKKAVLTSYATLDLKLKLEELENTPPSPIFAYSWRENVSFSEASMGYSIDVNGYGFKGWTGRIAKYVRLELYPDSIRSPEPGTTSLTFQLEQSAMNEQQTVPIPNLTPELVFVGSYPRLTRLPNPDSLEYLGNGTYVATFNETLNPHTSGVLLRVTTPDDNIWVQTSFYRDIYVTLKTREENGTSTNLGTIRFLNNFYSDGALGTEVLVYPTLGLPYLLQFIPDNSYTFVRWETDGFLEVQNLSSPTTGVMVSGSGNITAVYAKGDTIVPSQYYNIHLDSRELNNTSYNKGEIGLDSVFCTLPTSLIEPIGDYQLEYVPENESYTFYGWEFSGGVALVSPFPTQNTLINIYGDANITAIYVYSETPEPPPPPPPPPNGEWNSLYFDNKRTLVPGYMWSGHNGHDETHSSTGNMKQSTLLSTPILTPRIECAQKINITMFITPVPPESVKSIDIALGFTFNQIYYSIGNYTFNITTGRTIYQTTFDVDSIEFVPGQGVRVIPANSTIQLNCTVTFLLKNGFNFVYHGIDNPSRIDLF